MRGAERFRVLPVGASWRPGACQDRRDLGCGGQRSRVQRGGVCPAIDGRGRPVQSDDPRPGRPDLLRGHADVLPGGAPHIRRQGYDVARAGQRDGVRNLEHWRAVDHDDIRLGSHVTDDLGRLTAPPSGTDAMSGLRCSLRQR